MKVKIRSIKFGEDWAGGWVFSINLFNSVSNVNKGQSKIYVGQSDESIGFIGTSTWFR